ncbi:hypothetical protein [Synechococcus sp. 1G10]|uniref:hypothetical protein n=1 Tax=Synechococcus sp. 1G10 TaxID=2025605 RepID=UPI000B981311|nr:hypothetical protein [Synechococcus sp. 1G10]
MIQEILDGNQLYVDRLQAKVRQKADAPKQIRTGQSRGQLGFESGAVGRINRLSQLRLGSSCFVLSQGQILVSGNQSGCTRSSRLSVRGTNYIISLADDGSADVSVLEGSVLLEQLSKGAGQGRAAIYVHGGTAIRLSPTGELLSSRPLTQNDYRQILNGPLFVGFATPLPAMEALLSHLRRTMPGPWPDSANASEAASASVTATTRPEGRQDALVEAINALRSRHGRAPLDRLPDPLEARNRDYLEPVVKQILTSPSCDHDLPRWQSLQVEARSALPLRPVSELVACPRPTHRWDPEEIISTWMTSRLHQDLLLNRPNATHISCLGASNAASRTAVCVTWTRNTPTGTANSAERSSPPR